MSHASGHAWQRREGEAWRPLPRGYRRREPEKTILYRVVQRHLATMLAEARVRTAHGFGLPGHVRDEFERYLRCGILAHGFLRALCKDCGADRLIALSCKNRTVCPSCTTRRMQDTAAHLVTRVLPDAPYRQWVLSPPRRLRFRLARCPADLSAALNAFLQVLFAWQRRRARARGVKASRTGSVTFAQRFGSQVTLHVHFHATVPDGVWAERADGTLRFVKLPAPKDEEVAALLEKVVRRIEKRLPEDNDAPAPDADDALAAVQADSVQQPWAPAPHHDAPKAEPRGRRCAFLRGYSLHAAVAVRQGNREGLEYLARYGLRGPLALERMSERADGRVVLRLKRRAPDGSSHLMLEPAELLRRLASIIAPPRHHLTRYHGVFSAHSKWRTRVVPPAPSDPEVPDRVYPATVLPRRVPWSDLLQRVFDLDALRCDRCGGRMRLLAYITEPATVRAILTHLGLPTEPPRQAPARAPPAPDQDSAYAGDDPA